MAIRTVVTRGLGNGTFIGTIPLAALDGFSPGIVPPIVWMTPARSFVTITPERQTTYVTPARNFTTITADRGLTTVTPGRSFVTITKDRGN